MSQVLKAARFIFSSLDAPMIYSRAETRATRFHFVFAAVTEEVQRLELPDPN
jgi:hypothetical protein